MSGIVSLLKICYKILGKKRAFLLTHAKAKTSEREAPVAGGRRMKRTERKTFFLVLTPTQLSLPLCAGVQFSRHSSFRAFNVLIKVRENRGP